MTRRFLHQPTVLAAAGVVLLAYVGVLAAMPKHVFWAPDEGGRFIQMETIHWDHGLKLTLPYPGRLIDLQCAFFPHAAPGVPLATYPTMMPNGTIALHWPIWFSLITRPLWHLFGIPGLYLIPLLSGWLTAVAAGRLAFTFDVRLAPASILLVGLASPVFFYSQTLWDHTLATLLAVVAVLILVTGSRGRLTTLTAMAAALAGAMMLRFEMLAFAVAAICTWALSGVIDRRWGTPSPMSAQPSRAPSALIGLAAVVAVLGLLFVVALTPRHRDLLTTVPAAVVAKVAKLPVLPVGLRGLLVNAPESEGPVVPALWEWGTLIAIATIALGACVPRPFAPPLALLGMTAVVLFSGLVNTLSQPYRSLHGLIPVAPYVVVAVYALPQTLRSRDPRLTTLTVLSVLYLLFGVAANLFVYVDDMGIPLNTLEWGPRYLLTLYPLLAVLCVVAAQGYIESAPTTSHRRTFIVLLAAMISLGALHQLRGLDMVRSNRRVMAEWDRALREQGPIVTDMWWLPTAVAPLFTTEPMYVVEGRTQVADWLQLARPHGVSRFVFASLTAARAEQFGTTDLVGDGTRVVAGLHLTTFDVTDASAPR